MNRRIIGKYGEDLAERFLKSNGFQVIRRNYHTRYGELDLVCIKDDILYFIEVKYRKNYKYGSPKEGISYEKINRIKKTAMLYLKEESVHYKPFRLSFLGIVDANEPEYEFIENMLL